MAPSPPGGPGTRTRSGGPDDYPQRTVPQRHLPPDLDPRQPPRRRRGGWRRALSWIAVILSATVLVTSGVLWLAFSHYLKKITTVNGVTHSGGNDLGQTYLLVGSDSRNGASQADLQAAHTTADGGAINTDTIILLHFSAKRDHAILVSFPRDSWVTVPGFPGKHKINSAYALGKAQGHPERTLVDTVQSLSGLHVDHYVQIDFFGFLRMTQAIGGVEICLSQPAHDSYAGIDLPAGRQTISGPTALAFVRQRHGLPRGDLDRIQRQQAFIGATIRKVTSAGVLLDPFKLTSFLDAATKSLTVDSKLSTNDMRTLALRLRHLDPAHIQFETVPVADSNGYRDGLSVVLLDEPKLPAFFENVARDGEPTPKPSPAAGAGAPRLIVPPGGVRVQVLNGAGKPGLGRRAAGDLAGDGFVVLGASTASRSDFTHAVVRHGPGKDDSARTLAAAVSGATIEADPTLTSGVLQLVVGSDYSGVQPVKVTPATPPASPSAGASSGPATPTPPPVTAAEGGCIP